MSRQSIVGSGSSMPESFYLQKMEKTCIYEDPDQLNHYYRDTLKDLRPDEPFFESDAPRYNNYSQDRLNLRHCGKRVETDPSLPDGTFLDFEFLQKDPRGTALGPNMMQYRKQQESRGKFIKHGNDTDNSVPSAGWNPTHVVRDIKGQFYNTKSRMKIFDESFDGRILGGAAISQIKSTAACMQESDGKTPIMRDEMCYNRSRYLDDLSNNTSIGWRRTTDNRFQISKYGLLRPNAPLSTQNWSKNRSNAKLDHDILLSWKDQNVSKQLSIKMIDMARKKYNDIEAGKTVLLHNSKDNQIGRGKKLTSNDLSGIQSRQSSESRAIDSNTLLKHEVSPYKTKGHEIENRVEKAVIDPFIIEFISTLNRKMAPRDMKDLREQILHSGEWDGVLIENSNKKCNPKTEINNELLWNSEANHEKGRSMRSANYSKKFSNKISAKNKNDINYERYTKNSKITDQRRGKLLNQMYNMDVAEYDNTYGDEISAVKQIGHMGNKYMRRYMDRGEIDYKMSDITAKNFTVFENK